MRGNLANRSRQSDPYDTMTLEWLKTLLGASTAIILRGKAQTVEVWLFMNMDAQEIRAVAKKPRNAGREEVTAIFLEYSTHIKTKY